MAGILQSLADAAPEDVRFDYMLSQIGTEPARKKLIQYALGETGTTAAADDDDDDPGFYDICSLRTSEGRTWWLEGLGDQDVGVFWRGLRRDRKSVHHMAGSLDKLPLHWLLRARGDPCD